MKLRIPHLLSASALALTAGAVQADQVILDDLIVDGSACIGQDCVNGESFGFDTIRIKENNLRIRAFDTSSTASFPTRDWQITFNDSTNGGQNKFSIDDIDGGRTPFTIEAGAPSHSLYVEDGGRLGLGTSTPVADIHVKSGNTPTLRLEQDGSSGFSAQTWDLAGNEANFFIRDASNGSTLPFRIFPGAPSNALNIEATTGDIGIGTTSPERQLHLADTSNTVGMEFDNNNAVDLAIVYVDDELRFSHQASGVVELVLDVDGNLEASGDMLADAFIAGGTTLNVPDYVFGEDFELRPLSEVRSFIAENSHLPEVPSAAEINGGGLNLPEMQMVLLKKIEELTLYTLHQQDQIAALEARLLAAR